MNKKVLVVGFFDMFHSGHVEFFKKAMEYGDVFVSIATDENSQINKHKTPVYTQEERKFMVDSCKYVTKSEISFGRTDILSFEPQIVNFKPDIFIINEDGHSEKKKQLCDKYNVKYIILKRTPANDFPKRCSSDLKKINQIPLRVDFVSFFDQKKLNEIIPGRVIVANIKPIDVDEKSGMSSSTIKTIKQIFGSKLPKHIDKHTLAKILFHVENMNNNVYVSGAVDQIGICYSGIIEMSFDNSFWPNKIQEHRNSDYIHWLNNYLYIVQTKPRPNDFNLYDQTDVVSEQILHNQNRLSDLCLNTIFNKDVIEFGKCINLVHENQKMIWKNYESDFCNPIIKKFQKNHFGCKLMGAGGYGYALVVTDAPESDFLKIEITI